MPIPDHILSQSTETLDVPSRSTDSSDVFRLVAMSTNDGIWDWDLLTGHVHYSPRWLHFVGAAEGELPNNIGAFASRLHPDDVEKVNRALNDYLTEAVSDYSVEFRLKHRDGTWRWIKSRGAAMRDAEGTAYRLVGTHTEITEQVEMAERLERMVEERTVDLRAARDKAELAAAATTKFLAATSHDVRQPMQAMALLLPSLRREISSEIGRRTVDALDRSLAASMDLFESLLEYSRLDAGAMRPMNGPVHLGDLMADVVESFLPEARRRRVALKLVPANVVIRSDHRLLARILRNYVSNALKYTDRGSVLVGCRRLQDGIRLEVWDTGCGIGEQEQRQVFWEFVQIRDRREGVTGLGLGLAIVERLARLLGHRVAVQSRPGKGSVFSVTIRSAVVPEHRPAPRAPEPGRLRDGPCLIALLEDNREIASALADLMRDWGCEVIHAASTDDIVALLGGRAPDLVVADWHLGATDSGFHAFDRLEGLAGQPLPGIILTGDYDLARLKAVNAARRKVLHKPVAPLVLHAVLRGALAGAGNAPG
ncbi:MAG: PAS domain-containing protein [Zavarzinia sp.]|nr:PAS domain-containing protein [Zavarzinia sp.]